MEGFLAALATLLVAFSLGFIGKKLKMPAGPMVFAMIGVAALNILLGRAFLPIHTRPVLQFFGGAMIGHSITKADVKNLKKMWAPALMLIVAMIVLNLGVALLVWLTGNVSLSSALFACSPGGVSDMALIADELGADAGQVSVLQLFRLVGICLIYPVSFRYIGRRWPQLTRAAEAPLVKTGAEELPPPRNQKILFFLLTLACAGAVGFLLNLVSMPAAFMVGGVIGSCAFNLLSKGRAAFPGGLRFFVQAASGGLIGIRMDMDSIAALPQLLLPMLIMFAGMLLYTAVFGTLMRRMMKSDLLTGFMSVTPGGVQEMSIIAQDLNCDTAQVVTLHTVRVIAVICMFPVILKWLIGALA